MPLKPVLLTQQHITNKIKESFVQEFVKVNNLQLSPRAGNKKIYLHNSQDTQITASSKKFEVRQLKRGVTQVIAYFNNEWKLFGVDEIILGGPTRGGINNRSDEFNATLIGGTLIQ